MYYSFHKSTKTQTLQQIRIISERSCDTSNDTENTAFPLQE